MTNKEMLDLMNQILELNRKIRNITTAIEEAKSQVDECVKEANNLFIFFQKKVVTQ